VNIHVGHKYLVNPYSTDFGNDLISICVKLAGVNMGVGIDQGHVREQGLD
jgi:hypothetical protein